jgi:hypothetical protein
MKRLNGPAPFSLSQAPLGYGPSSRVFPIDREILFLLLARRNKLKVESWN